MDGLPSGGRRVSLRRHLGFLVFPPPDRAGPSSAYLPAGVNLIELKTTWLIISIAGRKGWFKTIVRKTQFNLFFLPPLQNVHFVAWYNFNIHSLQLRHRCSFTLGRYTLHFFFPLVLIHLKFSRKRFLSSDSRKLRDGFAFLLERIVVNHCETTWAIAVSWLAGLISVT